MQMILLYVYDPNTGHRTVVMPVACLCVCGEGQALPSRSYSHGHQGMVQTHCIVHAVNIHTICISYPTLHCQTICGGRGYKLIVYVCVLYVYCMCIVCTKISVWMCMNKVCNLNHNIRKNQGKKRSVYE